MEQTFFIFDYEIAEDEERYHYGLVGASIRQCLMSNIVRVVRPNEEGISIKMDSVASWSGMLLWVWIEAEIEKNTCNYCRTCRLVHHAFGFGCATT